MLNSTGHEIILFINVKMPTNDGILTLISRINIYCNDLSIFFDSDYFDI